MLLIGAGLAGLVLFVVATVTEGWAQEQLEET